MAQKHTEGPEGDQHDLVRSQKSGSGPTEMESNCGRPMSSMGQRGLDDDDDEIEVKTLIPLVSLLYNGSPGTVQHLLKLNCLSTH